MSFSSTLWTQVKNLTCVNKVDQKTSPCHDSVIIYHNQHMELTLNCFAHHICICIYVWMKYVRVLDGCGVPVEQALNIVISIFNGKRDTGNCRCHKDVKLLEHGMKVLERGARKRISWRNAIWIYAREGENSCCIYLEKDARRVFVKHARKA